MACDSDEASIKIYFVEDDWKKLSEYEKSRYINLKRNYEVLKSIGLNPGMPHFMVPEKKSNEMSFSNTAVEEGASNKDMLSHGTVAPVSRRNTPSRLCKNNIHKRESDEKNSTSHTDEPKTQKTPDQRVKNKVPFNKIMKKVVFVLSGFVNPMRSELRGKALKMGAKYKADWDGACTHLVCAFLNTPKYLQVRSENGIVVNEKWIIHCYETRTLLPWRDYILGSYDNDTSGGEESKTSGEELDSSRRRKNSVVSNGMAVPLSANKANCSQPVALNSESEMEDENTLGDYCMSDSDIDSDSGGDTEDEIRKIEKQIKSEISHSKNSTSDEELLLFKDSTGNLSPSRLPNIFKQKHFYIYGDFSASKYHELQNFIIAYNGVVDDSISNNIKYMVTEAKWDSNFDEVLSKNEDLIFVKPLWIYKCHEAGKFIPYQPYILIPDS